MRLLVAIAATCLLLASLPSNAGQHSISWEAVEQVYVRHHGETVLVRSDGRYELAAGEQLSFFLAAGHWLRVVGTAETLPALQMTSGNGAGLLSVAQWDDLMPEQNMLRPTSSERQIAMTNSAQRSVLVELYRGQVSRSSTRWFPIDNEPGAHGSVAFRQADGDRRQAQLAGPGRPLRVVAKQPTMSVQLRAVEPDESPAYRWLSVRDDSGQVRMVRAVPLPDVTAPLQTPDGCWRRAGRRYEATIDTAGNSQLWLEPAELAALTIGAGSAAWQWPIPNRGDVNTSLLPVVDQAFRLSHWLALDAGQSETAATTQAIAEVQSDLDAVATGEAERIYRRKTYWRPLGAEGAATRYRDAHLRPLSRSRAARGLAPPVVSHDSAQQRAQSTSPLVWFELQPGEAMTMPLPATRLSSRLQVLLGVDDTTPVSSGVFLTPLTLGFDQQVPATITYWPISTAGADAHDASAALAVAADVPRLPTQTALTAELAIPVGAGAVTVTVPPDGATRWLALRYRAPRSATLQQGLVRARFDQADQNWLRLQEALAGQLTQGDALAVYWPRLVARLRARAANFTRVIELERAPSSRDWPSLVAQLEAVGDRVLVDRILRGLALQSPSATRDWAFEQLVARYQSQLPSPDAAGQFASGQVVQLDPGRPLVWQGLLAHRLLHSGERKQLLPLAASLGDEGEHELAMLALLAAPAGVERNRLLQALSSARRWSGLAEQISERAGTAKASLSHWRTVRTTQASAAGRRLVASPDGRVLLPRWMASAEQPLKMSLVGPAVLRLSVRPLLDSAKESSEPAVVDVSVGTERQQWVIASNASSSLRLVGFESRIGVAEQRLIALSPGAAELMIQPRDVPLLIEVEQRTATGPRWQEQDATHQAATNVAAASEGVEVLLVEECLIEKVTVPAVSTGAPSQPMLDPAVSVSMSGSDSSAFPALQALIQRWRYEPMQRRKLWRQLLNEAQSLAPDQAVAWITQRVSGQWRSVDQVLASAGVISQPITAFAVGSSRQQLRESTLGLTPEQSLLPTTAVQHYALDSLRPVTLRISLQQHELPFSVPVSLPANLVVNGQTEAVMLQPGQRWQRELSLPAGQHLIALQRVDNYSDRYVSAVVKQATDRGWQLLDKGSDRQFQVVTPSQPLQLYLDRPALLRIFERIGRTARIRYRVAAAGEVAIEASPGAKQVWMRVARFEPRWKDEPRRRAVAKTIAAPASLASVERPSTSLRFVGAVSSPADDSWFVGLGWRERFELDASGDEVGERFTELEANYLRQQPFGWSGVGPIYWQSQLLLRDHNSGDPVVGTRHWLEWVPRHSPWSATANLNWWRQEQTAKRAASAALLQLDVDYRREWSARWWSRVRGGLFARSLSSSAKTAVEFAELDQDIASAYKQDHQYGWRLSHRIGWRPTLDQQWYSDIEIRGNEFGDDIADQVGATLAWRGFRNGMSLDAGLRLRHFLADDDRRRSATRERLFVNFSWLDFPAARWGWQARLGAVHDFDRADTSWLVRINWVRDGGRGINDYRPRSLSFRDLHQRRQQWRPGAGYLIDDLVDPVSNEQADAVR